MRNRNRFLAESAVIAAIYAALTLALSPISFGALQVRVSEGLIGLAFLTPAAVPGLTLGCFMANMIGPMGLTDALIGSAATLIGSLAAFKLRDRGIIALIPNVASNGLFVGFELWYFYGANMNVLLCMLFVAAGEALSTFVFAPIVRKGAEKAGIPKG